jgi:hypothetical protein
VVNRETERKPTGFCRFCEPCSSWPNASISQVGSEKTMNLLFSILRTKELRLSYRFPLSVIVCITNEHAIMLTAAVEHETEIE